MIAPLDIPVGSYVLIKQSASARNGHPVLVFGPVRKVTAQRVFVGDTHFNSLSEVLDVCATREAAYAAQARAHVVMQRDSREVDELEAEARTLAKALDAKNRQITDAYEELTAACHRAALTQPEAAR